MTATPQLIEPKNLLRDFPPNHRYLIGVSGGRDSIALLHQLVDLEYKKLIVCHLNHQLRGRSSNRDARFVRELAIQYDLDLESASANVRAFATKDKVSIEVAARTVRYQFFSQVAKRRRCRTLFLAHHADDLVETFLINLFRGAGSAGLRGMRQVSTRRIEGVGLAIVRPLLGVWRQQVDHYVRQHHLKFREDASNKNLVPLRNRIRRQIIPYLEKTLGRNVRQSICRAANIAAEEENFFDALLPEELSKLASLSVRPLRAMPIAVQRRMLCEWLRARDVPGVSFDLVERIRALLDLASGVSKTNMPRDRHARRRAGRIFIE